MKNVPPNLELSVIDDHLARGKRRWLNQLIGWHNGPHSFFSHGHVEFDVIQTVHRGEPHGAQQKNRSKEKDPRHEDQEFAEASVNRAHLGEEGIFPFFFSIVCFFLHCVSGTRRKA